MYDYSCFIGFPETKDKRLEKIAQLWEENVLPWQSLNGNPAFLYYLTKKLHLKWM